MVLPQRLRRWVSALRSVPLRYYIAAGVVMFGFFYAYQFIIPKTVAYSFAGDTCRKRVTLLPDLQRPNDSRYEVLFRDVWRVGSIPVAARTTCFVSKQAPKQGESTVSTAPFNGPLARTHYRVKVPAAPKLLASALKTEVPVSKDLLMPLSAPDSVHDYRLHVGEKQAQCKPSREGIACDLPSLKLAQGVAYTYKVERAYKGKATATVGEGGFTTLKAISLISGSVSAGQTVYARPTVLEFTADKPIDRAAVELRLEGKTVAIEQRIAGSSLSLQLKEELPREKTYELAFSQLEATDGSTLVEPYTLKFMTSGGPKVASVSIGSSGVAQSASAVLTFDQPLSKTKDVASFMSFTGGQAVIQRQSDTQLVVRLQGLPLCQEFSITVKQGIPSEHDLASARAWGMTSRTTCHQVTTYGSSVRGRPLTAYVFGTSGPVTMFTGGIHGNEPSSTTLMRAWFAELEAHPSQYAGKRVVVIPAINPDGLAAGTRANARGVNLNRNFPTDNWVKSIKDTDGNHPDGGGESPLSEPEAAALAKLLTSYRPRLLLSFHAVGSLAIGDPGGYSAGYAAKYATLVGYRDGTNLGNANFDYNISGAFEDWSYRNAGVPSIVVELSSYTSVYSAGHTKALWAMLE